jgi:hypothetical protein
LLSSSNAEINRLAALMNEDMSVSATLVGHTDSQGDDASNLDLSRRRAKAVYDALIDKGISASRLSYDGKGEGQPIATNATADGRLKNRRTEFITSGGKEEPDCNEYTNRVYQVVSEDARAESVEIPAEYTNRSYQKIAADAVATKSEVAAQYATRSFQKLVSAASTSSTDVPAEYRTITKRQLVKEGGFTEWREIVCEADITTDLIRRVQEALIERGYSVGTAGADNQMGPGTKAALRKFQEENGLPMGQLDIETLKALGIK